MKTKHPRCWLLACWLLISGHVAADDNITPLIEPQSQTRYDSLKQQGVEYFSDINTADYKFHWNLLIYTHEGEQQLSVFDANTDILIFQYVPLSGPLDRFIRQQLIERDSDIPLIASVWQRGAHGEQFVLLDPVNNRTLYQITSSWPLSVQVCNESIAITVTGDSNSEGIPAQQTHYWYSPDSVDIRSGMSSECLTETTP